MYTHRSSCKVDHKCTHIGLHVKLIINEHTSVFMYSTCYSCQVLIKPEFPRYIFLKNFGISNFMKICPVAAELFHAGRHDDSNSSFLQFC